MLKKIILTCALFFAGTAHTAHFTPDYDQSFIKFSGVHAGNAFKGVFNTWKTNIHFDFEIPQNSVLSAEFDMTSAQTGNAMYDGTLPTLDWFHVTEHPTAHFKSTLITALEEEGAYTVVGTLTLKGTEQSISFPVYISKQPEGHHKAEGSFSINRFDFNIGTNSDPKAEWVSQEIVLNMQIFAKSH